MRIRGTRFALLVTVVLCCWVRRAEALIILCLPNATVVPENPSIVVAEEDLPEFRAVTPSGVAVSFKTRRLSDYHLWVTLQAKDGMEISINRVEGPHCAQFRKLRVSKAYRADRADPIVTKISPGSLVAVTLQSRPVAWMKTEWGYSRDDLTSRVAGVDISGFGQGSRDPWYGMIRAVDQPLPIYLRLTTLLPDGSTGGTWQGWVDTDGTFGAGLTKSFAVTLPQLCATTSPWITTTGRFLVDGFGQPRYRALDQQRRPVPVRLVYTGKPAEYELVVPFKPGAWFWVQSLPLGGASCHGPFRISKRLADLGAVSPDGAREYGEDPVQLEGIQLALRTPTLWWKLRIDWSERPWDHVAPGTARTRTVHSAQALTLAYGDDITATASPVFVRITSLFADGKAGPVWSGQLVRNATTKQIDVFTDRAAP